MSDFPDDLVLYLTELGEPEDNALRVVVAEAKAEGPLVPIPDVNISGRQIVIASDSRFFELLWESYVGYSVRDESYAQFDDDRPKRRGAFVERTSSAYLRFILETTFATAVLPGPLRHWEVLCLNHFIDVVSGEAPTIRQISGASWPMA